MPVKAVTRSLFACKQFLPSVLSLSLALLAPGLTQAATSAASDCNPLSVETCGLPFPSDVFETAGGYYGFDNTILDKRRTASNTVNVVRTVPLTARGQLPDNFRPGKVFNGSRGFSPLGPVLFELRYWPQHEIPADGENHLHVYNMRTGERVPMRVSLSDVAKGSDGMREARPVVIGWPETRFDFGERYLAILYKEPFNAAVTSGQDIFLPTENVIKALEGQTGWILDLAYERPRAAFDALGIDKSNILSFTWFTVKPENEVTAPMQYMVQQALQQPQYFSELAVAEKPLGDEEVGLVTLTGKVSMVNFRSSDGGVAPDATTQAYDRVINPQRERVDFTLTLPQVEPGIKVPLNVWSHGLGQSRDFEVTRGNYRMGDRLGMATIGIDHPNHGSRATYSFDTSSGSLSEFGLLEPYVGLAAQNSRTILHMLGMFIQGVVDQTVLIHNSRYNLPTALAAFNSADYPDLPQLDTSNIVLDTLSLGAMLGVTVGAVSPDLTGVYLANGAGSLMQTFSQSTFWPVISRVIPLNLNGAEATFLLAMMQHYLDIADGNNFAHFYRESTVKPTPTKFALHYSLGDGSVPNSASLATAALADLPLLQTVIEPVPMVRFGQNGLPDYENGYGLIQSGYGYENGEQTIDSITNLNLGDTLGISELGTIDELLNGSNISDFGVGDSVTDYLSGALGLEGGADLQQYVDVLYDGDMQAFLTHFNRGNRNARQRQISWRCDLLSLDPDRCDLALEKAYEEIEKIENGEFFDESESGNDIVDAIDSGLSGIEVKEGSGGSMTYGLIGALALLLLRRRRAQLCSTNQLARSSH